MSSQPSANNIAVEMEREYQEFLTKLDLLKKEQDQLIKEYREKLEQRKLLRQAARTQWGQPDMIFFLHR